MDDIKHFLELGGAEILPVTNPWEVVRFKTPRGIHVVYTNAKGNKSYSDDHARQAYAAFHQGKKWMAADKVARRSQRYLKAAIEKRDGKGCFYCNELFNENNGSTIEHLLSVAHGGTNGINNLVLAHQACNLEAGSMSIMEKILLREKQKFNH